MTDIQPDRFTVPPHPVAAPEAFAQRVEEAVHTLFGNEESSLAVRALTRQLRQDCRRLRERGLADTPTIAIVGLGAHGKSWLARCFLEDHPDNAQVRADIRTGQNSEDRSDRLTWLMPQSRQVVEALPESEDEIFLRVPAQRMLDLGSPYQVLDTPGLFDARAMEQLLHRAVTSAPIKLVVVSIGQLRDGGYVDFVRAIDGSVIVPVILFEPDSVEQTAPAGALWDTVQQEIRRWHGAAPAADIQSDELIFMPLAHIFGSERAERLVRQRLQTTLRPLLANPVRLEMAIERQMRERVTQTRAAIRQRLEPFRLRVSSALEALERKQWAFPERILEELFGDAVLFRAGLRQRFRIDWIERTPLVCFPYRSLLGVLALTHGAWDRLVFSIFGSVPSLGHTLFQTLKNTREARQVARMWEGRLQSRIEELLREHCYTEVRNFRTALAACLHLNHKEAQTEASHTTAIHLRGLNALEAASRRILSHTIEHYRARDTSVLLCAGLGFGSFAYLIAGPLVWLYRVYLNAHGKVLGLEQPEQIEFRTLEPAMLFTSLVLSLAPAFLVALIGMSWSCQQRRVSRALLSIQEGYRTEIAERFADETLAIEIDDPAVDAARFLLSL